MAKGKDKKKDKGGWPEWLVFLILCVVAFPVAYTERPEAHSDGVVRPAAGITIPQAASTSPASPAAPTGESKESPARASTRPKTAAWPRSEAPRASRPAPARPVSRPAAKPLKPLTAGLRKRFEAEAKRTSQEAGQVLKRVQSAVTYKVAVVVDGDTIRLESGKTVRLLQVDTPEVHGRAECFGAVASEATRRLLAGKRVRLVSDPTLDDTDRYGRLLRYVYLGDQNVNLRLVSEGVAAPYFYRGERGLFAWSLDKRAREARAGERGLWGACPKTAYAPTRAVATGPVYRVS